MSVAGDQAVGWAYLEDVDKRLDIMNLNKSMDYKKRWCSRLEHPSCFF